MSGERYFWHSISKNLYISISAIETGGLRLPEYVFGQSVTGEYYDSVVLNEIGADIVLRPDSETCRLVPWYEGAGLNRLFMTLSIMTERLCHSHHVLF